MGVQFGKVKSLDGGRVVVLIDGAGGSCAVEALLLQPCGVAGPAVWLPPSAGDVVAVAFDDERPENSVVLGVVYPDDKKPPKTDHDAIAIQATTIFIGDDVGSTESCPREDRLQDQLKDIKAELDSIASAFNSHTHPASLTVAGSVTPAGAVSGTAAGSTLAPSSPHSNSYSVGSTASDSVKVK